MAFDPTEEMKRVFDKGDRVTIRADRSDYISVLAPVRDSLDEIVGFVEICTRTQQWDRAGR